MQYINKDRQYRGIVSGISEARQKIKVGTIEYDIGFIYPVGTFTNDPVKIEKKKPARRLSNILKSISKEPPGGWNESDMVF